MTVLHINSTARLKHSNTRFIAEFYSNGIAGAA
ncbi:MAG: hypothetical protein ACI8QT_001537 [Halioglobus sp.]|jgi:hypothetical protein